MQNDAQSVLIVVKLFRDSKTKNGRFKAKHEHFLRIAVVADPGEASVRTTVQILVEKPRKPKLFLRR